MPAISGLNAAVSVNDADELAIIQGGETKRLSADKLGGLKAVGIEQVLQDVTAQRTNGVVYTNTSNKPIFVFIKVNNDVNGGTVNSSFWVDGQSVMTNIADHAVWGRLSFVSIVPPGATYKLNIVTGTGFNWFEYK